MACLEFGGVERFKEECREARWEHHLDILVRDFRFALRGLAKDRRFAFIAILALALGELALLLILALCLVQASMQQGEIAREFAEKRFEAEQKKYELGVTQLFFVLDAQTQLNQAENDLLRQSINYRRSLINLYLITGELLAERGVALD